MQHYPLSQMIAEGSQALVSGGFDLFYQTQLTAFLQHHTAFNYGDFANTTNRATRPLTTTGDLLAYNTCYAADHFARFSHLLAQLPKSSKTLCDAPVCLSVFDYGCGQGLASLALLTHLQDREVDLVMHLIEPSEMALQAAAQYVQAFASTLRGQVRVQTYACGLDQLPDTLFVLPAGHTAVHLFSNVLDVSCLGLFDLSRLTRQMSSMCGKHLCLAVGPDFSNSQIGFDAFKQQFAAGQAPLFECNDWPLQVTSYRCVQRRMDTRVVNGRYMALVRTIAQPLSSEVA